MNWDTYSHLASRTENMAIPDDTQWQVAIDGIVGETLEYYVLRGLVDITRLEPHEVEELKKLHPPVSAAKARKELGDITWYLTLLERHSPIVVTLDPEREVDADWPWLPVVPMPWMNALVDLSESKKKTLWHGHLMDWEVVQEAARAIAQTVADECAALGVSPSAILDENIEKLERRYPTIFTPAASISRSE